jgi:hypothetical protein
MPPTLMDSQLQILSHDAYLALRSGATVIERDGHGDKVLQLANGSYLKLFRRKRLISSAAWYPYAERFADNAIALKRRGIACPEVIAVYRIPDIARDAVHYWPLVGKTLRHIVRSESDTAGLHEMLGHFITRLHEAGVYFRSLHLGNIVLTPDEELGLIDIADLKAESRPLSNYQRRRNFQHLNRDPQDQSWLARNLGQLVAESEHASGRD